MAVILQITYSKKLGLPGFSSHSCSVSLTTEIQDKEMAGEESAKLYQLLQSAVDKEIQSVGWMPAATYGMPEQSNGNGNGISHHRPNGNQSPRANGNGDRWNCTEGQRGFILRILNENSIPKQDTEDLANQLFGTGVRQLNKMQASQLIEELLLKAGKPPRQNRWRPQQSSQPQTTDAL